MTDFQSGMTVERKTQNGTETLTLTKPCSFGGWYGTDAAGNTRRVTEDTFIITTNSKTNVQEDNKMASNKRNTVTAADRRARREAAASFKPSGSAATAEPSASEKLDMADAKPAAKQTPKAKPAATSKPTAKAKPRATKQTKIEPVVVTDTATPSEPIFSFTASELANIVTKVVDERIAAFTAEFTGIITDNTPTPTVQEDTTVATTTRRTKPAAKTVKPKGKTITLKAVSAKKNSWYFKYQGTSKTPLVTGCYVSNEAIALLESGEKSITVGFDHGEAKKHSILFRESGDTLSFNGSLYIMRAALNGTGISEDTPITVTLSAKSDDEIALTIAAA